MVLPSSRIRIRTGPVSICSPPSGPDHWDVDHALRPLARDTAGLAQLKRDLAVVISAEALFTLTDLCGLSPEDAIASAVHTARTLTQAATGENRLAAARV
ncbi:MAG TPA: hypothetical protein VFJ07_04215 [Streptosporangiaceae bacterium]|nr:hypothetical protein [Streptosporangiaceae bacterium]